MLTVCTKLHWLLASILSIQVNLSRGLFILYSEEREIQTFSTNCSSEDAICHCNEKDYSSSILSSMLENLDGKEQEEAEKKQESNRVQLNEEEELLYQNMEYIYPNQELTKSTAFQKGFCSKYLIRCKQDCPAAFSS